MQRPEERRASTRAIFIGRLFFVWGLLVFGRLIQLQILKHDELKRAAEGQHQHTIPVAADRGEILDRNGQPMAVSIRTQSVAVNPQRVPDPDFFAGNVAPILALDAAALGKQIRFLQDLRQKKTEAEKAGVSWKRDSKEPSTRQLFLKRHITAEEKSKLQSLPFKFIEFLRDAKRIYPNDELAVHVVGGLDSEGNGNIGMEARLNKELKGRAGKMRVLNDSRQDTYFSWIEDPGEQGLNLTLTLHRLVQHTAEVELKKALEVTGAWAGSVVVMDPQNGEVLAMANAPTFDRSKEPESEDDMRRRTNIAVQAPCEPGSVMKMITVTMGIDTGKFTPETPIHCENGAFPRPGRRPIHDVHPYGVLDVAGVLIKSSNIGVTKISLALGPDHMAEYLHRFGMGQKTDVGLPGESRGMLRPRDRWDPASHEYMAFGHEISATAIQLARAVAVIANGGLLVHPRIVLKKERPSRRGGVLDPIAADLDEPKRVLSPETSFTVRKIMERVVTEGTGKLGKVPGYTAGGKTGSAELYDAKRKMWVDRHNSSFIGFAPVTNPRVVVVVTLNGSVKLGGASAAPVFSKVTETALRVLQVPKDQFEEEPTSAPVEMESPLLAAQLKGQSTENEVQPESRVEPVLTDDLIGPRVPDFRGQPLALVLRQSLSLGLPVRVVGAGIVKDQQPSPGTILPVGTKIRLECRR